MSGRKGSELKEKINRGERVFGTFISLTDPLLARMFAQIGFDFILIDTEHGTMNVETLQSMLLMFEGTGTCPIVRVPWHEPAWTKWALDAGAEGILFPNVMNAEAARQAVSNCRYPPDGLRGFFPRAASNFLWNLDEYMQEINQRIVVWTQVEHHEAISNLDAILEVKGIDALFIGPADLSLSLGVLGRYDSPIYRRAIEGVFKRASSVGMPVAYHLYDSSPEALAGLQHGVQIFSYSTDWLFARQGAEQFLKQIREVFQP